MLVVAWLALLIDEHMSQLGSRFLRLCMSQALCIVD